MQAGSNGKSRTGGGAANHRGQVGSLFVVTCGAAAGSTAIGPSTVVIPGPARRGNTGLRAQGVRNHRASDSQLPWRRSKVVPDTLRSSYRVAAGDWSRFCLGTMSTLPTSTETPPVPLGSGYKAWPKVSGTNSARPSAAPRPLARRFQTPPYPPHSPRRWARPPTTIPTHTGGLATEARRPPTPRRQAAARPQVKVAAVKLAAGRPHSPLSRHA
jgi:hypothetical protein